MTSLTIDAALTQSQSIWFQNGFEDLRFDAINWLKNPESTIPAIFQKIGKALGISNQSAIMVGKLIEDQEVAKNLHISKEFGSMPISAIDLFFKAQALYNTRLKNPDSSGAADKKVMYGQWRGDKYKPGLLAKTGDFFEAHVAYYMAISGLDAVREVRRATGWSLSRLKGLLLIAIREINWIKKAIGLRTLNTLNKTIDRGMHFFSSVFAVLSVKLKAKDLHEETEESVSDDEADDNDDDLMDASAPSSHTPDPDPDDDDYTARPLNDYFDNPHKIKHEGEPHAKLKAGRELAFDMLNRMKKSGNGNARLEQLMNAIDPQILVNALQKDITQDEIPERMTTFLAFCWQWAEKTGIFQEKEYQYLVNVSPESMVKQTINAVQEGYWEIGNNKPQDTPKIWLDIMYKDDIGREKIAKINRPCSKSIKTRPQDGRNIIINPGPELRVYFAQHIKRAVSDERIRYIITTDGITETITCQQLTHSRKSPVALPFDDDFEISSDENETNSEVDALELTDQKMTIAAQTLGISLDLLNAAKFGDERALAVIRKAAQSMDEEQRDALMTAMMSDQ